jgi:hypothetical protein
MVDQEGAQCSTRTARADSDDNVIPVLGVSILGEHKAAGVKPQLSVQVKKHFSGIYNSTLPFLVKEQGIDARHPQGLYCCERFLVCG